MYALSKEHKQNRETYAKDYVLNNYKSLLEEWISNKKEDNSVLSELGEIGEIAEITEGDWNALRLKRRGHEISSISDRYMMAFVNSEEYYKSPTQYYSVYNVDKTKQIELFVKFQVRFTVPNKNEEGIPEEDITSYCDVITMSNFKKPFDHMDTQLKRISYPCDTEEELEKYGADTHDILATIERLRKDLFGQYKEDYITFHKEDGPEAEYDLSIIKKHPLIQLLEKTYAVELEPQYVPRNTENFILSFGLSNWFMLMSIWGLNPFEQTGIKGDD